MHAFNRLHRKPRSYAGPIEVLDDSECWPPCRKTVLVRATRAKELLGWRPKKKLMLDEVGLYYRQWLAYRDAGDLDERGVPKRDSYGR